MGNTWGKNIRLSIFGESHGKGIGIVIDGLKPGIELDLEEIQKEMDRRKPGEDFLSTTRKEDDKVNIISGYFEGKTTGTPLCGTIENTDTISKDYNKDIARPGHSDYTGFIKYEGFNDYRGGGHFSGRLTAPLVFAGAIAKQVLAKNNIFIGGHIKQIHGIYDEIFDKVNIGKETLEEIKDKSFPVINAEIGNKIKEEIIKAKEELDSVGGEIEVAILGLEAGIGEPFFDSIESKISSILFSVPAVKGVEFGAGFNFANMFGSESNDEFYIENGKVGTYTNNNSGVNGGITNGMPIIFSVAIKPTASISKKQKTIDMKTKENVEIEVRGRHDPCIVHRVVPVIEAVTAIAILDLI